MSFLTRIWFSEEGLRNVSLHLPKNVGVAAVTPPWQRMHLWDICHCFSACFGHLWETLYRDFGYTGSLPWTHGSKGGLHFAAVFAQELSQHPASAAMGGTWGLQSTITRVTACRDTAGNTLPLVENL